jgi:hypothetical protein
VARAAANALSPPLVILFILLKHVFKLVFTAELLNDAVATPESLEGVVTGGEPGTVVVPDIDIVNTGASASSPSAKALANVSSSPLLCILEQAAFNLDSISSPDTVQEAVPLPENAPDGLASSPDNVAGKHVNVQPLAKPAIMEASCSQK